jgi:hypothetical protein
VSDYLDLRDEDDGQLAQRQAGADAFRRRIAKVPPCRIDAAAVGSLDCALARLGQDQREQPRVLLTASITRLRGAARLSAHRKGGEPDDHPDCSKRAAPITRPAKSFAASQNAPERSREAEAVRFVSA